jgi:hypothetical protein
MDTKRAKVLDAIWAYFATDLTRDNDAVERLLGDICAADVSEAFTMWEFLLIRQEKKLPSSPSAVDMFVRRPLEFFTEKNPRTAKIVLETPMFQKAVYLYLPEPVAAIPLDIVVSGMLGGKLAESEEILRYLLRNTAAKKSYGAHMKIIIEKLYLELLKKQGGATKKVNLPKKLYTLLSTYVKKITGPEKALLEQRLKEVM